MRRSSFLFRGQGGVGVLLAGAMVLVACSRHTSASGYTNPLQISLPSGGAVENCPDPTIIRGQGKGDNNWYAFCTSDPLNDADKNASGKYNSHLVPTLKSSDLVSWSYVNDALPQLPGWARADSDIWAPDISYFDGKYHLYFVVTETVAGGSAIGAAVADSPTGPWTIAEKPVVEPHEAPCCGNSKRWTFDPEILIDEDGSKYIYYGSYFGGISVRKLSADGMTSDPYSQVEVTIANRYEAPSVIKHLGYYYLLASSSNCCNGALTGYSVFAGRSLSPTGPFVDKEGVLLTAGQVGGTRVLAANGNRWIGTGHNKIFTDAGGQEWVVYHAIDRKQPFFPQVGTDGPLTKRHLLMDPLDWVDGWPTVRGGQGASDGAMDSAPAAQPGEQSSYSTVKVQDDAPGSLISAQSDDFDGSTLRLQWSWLREPPAGEVSVDDGSFRFDTQPKDLFGDINNAPVLHEAAPSGNYLIEAKLSMNLPATGCCHNYAQAGLLISSNDDNYVKLVMASIWETRQITFAKEVGPVPAGFPLYGEIAGGPAADTIWLRIAKRDQGDEELYTAYSSRDGKYWSRAGTWTHKLGSGAQIGLVSMANDGFTARFDYVRAYTLK